MVLARLSVFLSRADPCELLRLRGLRSCSVLICASVSRHLSCPAVFFTLSAVSKQRETWRICVRARLEVTDITSAQFRRWKLLTAAHTAGRELGNDPTLCAREEGPLGHTRLGHWQGPWSTCDSLHAVQPLNPPHPHCKWSW